MSENFEDIRQIRDLVERWVVYRDAYEWDKLRAIWHPDGIMQATWGQSTVDEFIEHGRRGQKNGVQILHYLGGSAIEVEGARAVAMNKATILQRAQVDGVLCDVTCYCRQYDLWEKRDGAWGLVFRATVADRDRIDPVRSSDTLSLDPELLSRFPEEYRHLGYLQTRVGFTVNPDCPRLGGGAATEALYQKGADWLAKK